jgi:hypothetical protein
VFLKANYLIVSHRGIKVNPEKINAIIAMDAP